MADMLLGTLDQYEVQFITYFMARLPQIVLRATCPYGRKVFIPEKISLPIMLREAAKGDHRDLCELAREWGTHYAPKFLMDFSMMFSTSAYYGHLDMCILAKKWIDEDHYVFDATAISENLRYAASGADPVRARDICIFIHDWIIELSSANKQPPAMHLRGMINTAVMKGYCELCILALKWGRESPESDITDINEILINAAQVGHQNICEVFRTTK